MEDFVLWTTAVSIKDTASLVFAPNIKELGYTGEAQEVTFPISSFVHSLEGGTPSELL